MLTFCQGVLSRLKRPKVEGICAQSHASAQGFDKNTDKYQGIVTQKQLDCVVPFNLLLVDV